MSGARSAASVVPRTLGGRIVPMIPPIASSVSAGMDEGMLDVGSMASKRYPPKLRARWGKVITGMSFSNASASGRMYWNRVVGTNFSPKRLPPFAASTA